MLIALALMAQDAPLNVEAERAMTCAIASAAMHAGEADPPMMKLTAYFSYFAMAAARADPGDGPYVDRVNALTDIARTRPAVSQAIARGQIAECDRLYPLARSDAAATLPADPYRRGLTCFGSVMIMYGAAQGLEKMRGEDAELKRLKPAYDYYSRQVPELLRQRGIPMSGLAAEIDVAMKASLAIGNSDTIATSCIAQLPRT